MKRHELVYLTLLFALTLSGCNQLETVLNDIVEEDVEEFEEEVEESQEEAEEEESPEETLDPDGYYSSPEDVALYIHTYDELPDNYLTKQEARELGWDPTEGNLWDVTDEMLIGGDEFGNREGVLPEDDGREYFEADVNYVGGYRGAERLVYSNDGLIYYTDDHYDTFELLYEED